MTTKSIDLNHSLYKILIEDQLDSFSVLELRDAFMKSSELLQDKDNVRRFVYRHILRLERMQLLERVIEKTSQKAKYRKTVLFSKAVWNTVIEERAPELIEPKHQEGSFLFPKMTLQKRLEQCESDFLACIHEFETYKSLCSEYPHLADSLLDVQGQTKTQSSKLVGEMRAIKMALTLS
ncbi:hypothetical protein EIJ81_06505 [Aliivibrio salmonicida]|uniref:Transcriptional regulator VspR n=1 Tax=Aliivibrio salmonicida (strain LFI1238) TaxID=316275 RepID=B6EID5_ALISL|nr:hypothetical protein [Aliivibrio salmonicida]AZL84315.1 hypothetical protein EIJ81_06505 [Aliivibrio salmonicida]CAQ78646.1 hypothetical protein VSAL_I0961 [Aliivibrio salmonicida LFI1238]